MTCGAPLTLDLTSSDLGVVATRLGDLALAAPSPTGLRVVGVDGRSGAGKSTIASALAARLGAALLPLDDLVTGWHALASGPALAELWAVRPALAGARHLDIPRWDWLAGAFGPPVPLDLGAGVLILDGVGATALPLAPHITTRVWVEAPRDERRQRFHDRDGGALDRWWDVWAQQEEALLAGRSPREAADAVILTGAAG